MIFAVIIAFSFSQWCISEVAIVEIWREYIWYDKLHGIDGHMYIITWMMFTGLDMSEFSNCNGHAKKNDYGVSFVESPL